MLYPLDYDFEADPWQEEISHGAHLADIIHRIDLVDIFHHNLAVIVPPFDYENDN